MKLAQASRAVSMALLIGCAGCSPNEVPEAAPRTAAIPSAGADWVRLEAAADAPWLEAPAVVRAAAHADGDVAASVRAQVTTVHVQPGTAVAKGDPVLDVSAPEWIDAAATLQGASKRLAVHEARSQELLALRDRGLVGRAEVFAQQALVADLSAQRARAAATLRSAGIAPAQSGVLLSRGVVTLRAPVAGVVTDVHAHPGQIREPGDVPFAHIRGRAEARLEVRSFERWPEGAPARFSSTDGEGQALSGKPLSQVIDRTDGTHVTWLAFADEELELPEGLRGVVQVEADESMWRVPSSALFTRDDASFVRRQRGEVESDVAVQPIAGDGEQTWIRALEPALLSTGDRVAAIPGAVGGATEEEPLQMNEASEP